jgi:hypothetical protein
MNRDLLQRISSERRKDSAALLKAGLYAGAYYMAGYAVECAEASRYDLSINQAHAVDLYYACTGRASGVLGWIRKRW